MTSMDWDRMVVMYSSKDEVQDSPDNWQRWVRQCIVCDSCALIRADWLYSPFKMPVLRPPIAAYGGADVFRYIRRPLWSKLSPYMEHVYSGSVVVETHAGIQPTNYFFFYPHRDSIIYPYRGRLSRHIQCESCGGYKRKNSSFHPVIVARSLDHRRIYLDDVGDIFMDAMLVSELNLKECFPELRFYPVPVVPEPLDGDTLPGDPGWTGTFKERRMPTDKQIKGGKLIRGIRLYENW